MLTITVGDEGFNDTTQEFVLINTVELELEHSLVSLSKWESKHKKPFLSSEKTAEEILSYLRCMMVNPDQGPDVLNRLSAKNMDEIQKYIDSTESATTFMEVKKRPGPTEVITAELIYYWMVAFTIPMECERWHLNRLFALVRICSIKNSKPEQMPRHEIAQRNRELNKQRRAHLGTSG